MSVKTLESPGKSWPSEPQAFALAHAERVIAALEQLLRAQVAAAAGGPASIAAEARAALRLVLRADSRLAESLGLPLPDALVARHYGLSSAEQDVLWLCVAPHLEPSVRRWLAQLAGDPHQDYPNGERCLDVLCDGLEQRLSAQLLLRSGGRLVRSGLLRPERRGSTLELLHELVPASHLVSFFGGTRALGPEVGSVAMWVRPVVSLDEINLPPGPWDLLHAVLEGFYKSPGVSRGWHGAGGMELARGVGLMLGGLNGAGRGLAVRALTHGLGRDLIEVQGSRLAVLPLAQAEEATRALCQQAELYGEVLLMRQAGLLMGPDSPLAAVLADEMRLRAVAVVFLVEDERPLHPALEARVLMRQPFDPPTDERFAAFLWQVSLPEECVIPPQLDFRPLTETVRLNPTQIRNAAHLAYLLSWAGDPAQALEGPVLTAETLKTAALAQVAKGIGRLAELAEPQLKLDDIVLPERTDEQLREVVSAVRSRRTVLETWGLRDRLRRGLGLCCLFDGEPGTGKTLAAEVIAGELGLRLLRVNVSEVVDKYIGETEKNLARIFAMARPDLHVLLFDEADSLFSKRTEVGRSADRYSNMEINVLLTLIERYEGVTVLTTNLKKGIDQAFERRFTFKIHFPVPGPPERERIWRHFLADSPMLGGAIDFRKLAAVELSGGEIKNAVIKAAYDAAQDETQVTLEHLIDAAQREAVACGHLVRVA